MRLPRVVFVLGKGGVGRSTVAAALGLSRARAGERVLVFEWTVRDPFGPWFGLPPAGLRPVEIAPGLSVVTYELEEALRAYFVDHLHLGTFYRRIVRGTAMQRLLRAAPGIAELLFLGQIWWLTTLAEREAGLRFDRLVVDAPATGHGASLLDLPAMLAGLEAQGLLRVEIQRVVQMMGDPQWTGALVVTLAEELAIDETLELVPRVRERMGRPPVAALVNRSAARWCIPERPPGLEGLDGAPLTRAVRLGLAVLRDELLGRAVREREVRERLAGETRDGTFSLDEQLAALGPVGPRAVVEALSLDLARIVSETP